MRCCNNAFGVFPCWILWHGFCEGSAHATVEYQGVSWLGFCLRAYLHEYTRQCMKLVIFQVSVCCLKGKWYLIGIWGSILEMVQRSPQLSTHRIASCIFVWQTLHEEDSPLSKLEGSALLTRRPCWMYGFLAQHIFKY